MAGILLIFWEASFSDLVQCAMRFAREFHEHIDRRRKYSNQPYSVHLVQVVKIVASATDDEEMTASICV